jgi:DNA ligase (NAD+)
MIQSAIRWLSLVFRNEVAAGKVFHPSLKCPECGSKLWAETGPAEPAVWLCPNPDCPAELRARIAHWCSPGAMDIAGGEALATQLVKSGLVLDVAELYRLKPGELPRLEQLDAQSAKNFLKAIAASKQRDLWRVLYGLRILHVSANATQSLGRRFPGLHHVLEARAGQLKEAEEVDEEMAQSIVYWYGDSRNRDLIKRLEKAGVNFKSETYRPAGKTE